MKGNNILLVSFRHCILITFYVLAIQSQVTEVTFDTINSQPMTVWEFVINFWTGILLKYQHGKGI